MREAVVIATTLLLGALPVFAEQGPATPQVTARLGALRAAQALDPYSKLFEVRSALNQAVEQQSQKAGAPKKKVVCGMTIIEVGPELDPKMGVTPPKDEKTRFAMRAVAPPICSNK